MEHQAESWHGCINWIFGRGLSIACNLPWAVPAGWRDLERTAKIQRISAALRAGMDLPGVDCAIIQDLLAYLATHTAEGWRHRFITTNWDFLLQREITRLGLTVQPPWMANSHVFHLNGTVEVLENNQHRSPFLLEEDPTAQRQVTVEANVVYNQMTWDRYFVVVGMSFECQIDKGLLAAFSRVRDDLPVGASAWTVVNPASKALQLSCERIRRALPRAAVVSRCATLGDWLRHGLPELRQLRAIH